MNSDTGEIKDALRFNEMLMHNPKERGNWFEIDHAADPNCRACSGEGFIGYFPNAKVIPCPCVFDTHMAWSEAVIRQRDLGRAEADRGLTKIRRKQ